MSDPSQRPLVLDVDGTMIRSDLTHELLFEGFRTAKPWHWPRLLRLALTDKPALKAEFVARIGDGMAPELHPLEPLAVGLAETAKVEGREVYLCSGSEQSLVERLAAVLPYVDGAFGTVPGYNMTAQNKADFLTERFPDGFDYVGNSSQDYEPWEAAHTAFAIRPPTDALLRRSQSGESVNVLEKRTDSVRDLDVRDEESRLAVIAGSLLVTFAMALWLAPPDGDDDWLIQWVFGVNSTLFMYHAWASWRTVTHAGDDRKTGRPNPVAEGRLSLVKRLKIGAFFLAMSFVLTIFTWPWWPLFILPVLFVIGWSADNLRETRTP